MFNYIITNPIGRLGNHIITYINTIFLHLFFSKDNYTNNNYITLNNNNNALLKNNVIISNEANNKVHIIPKNIIPRIINGYDIFHLTNLFITKNINNKICFEDYLKLCNNYIPLLWNKQTITKFNTESKQYFMNFISTNYINLDTTLVIHIKCTDNTIPDKIIHKKYNIYPSKIYLEICKKYNYDTIIIITDNPNHIIIQNLLNHKSTIRILCPSSSMINDIYFLINAKNILIDNSTFTWVCSMHPFIYNNSINQNKTLFFYKDFFEKFLLDINTNTYDKNILNFCINSQIAQLDFNLSTQYIDFKYLNTIENANICNCNNKNSSNDKNSNNIIIARNPNNILQYKNNFTIIIFDYNSNIKIGEWIGNINQIKSLLL